MTAVIRLEDIMKTYVMGDAVVHALDHVSVEIGVGEFTSIMGPSGSGKSTMMNILGCLDRPTSGQYYLDGKEVAGYSDDELARTRNAKIGFVFQNFNLLPKLTARENVILSMDIAGYPCEDKKAHADEVLKKVALGQKEADRRILKLSGGQQQRVSIGRALMNDPALLLADEPTGNLDSANSHEIMELLKLSNKKYNQTLVVITHDENIALQADRIIEISDGRITRDEVIR